MRILPAIIIAAGIVVAAVIVAAGNRYESVGKGGSAFDRWTGTTIECEVFGGGGLPRGCYYWNPRKLTAELNRSDAK